MIVSVVIVGSDIGVTAAMNGLEITVRVVDGDVAAAATRARGLLTRLARFDGGDIVLPVVLPAVPTPPPSFRLRALGIA